jgi:hypothetical protein
MKGNVSNPVLYDGYFMGCISEPKVNFVKWGNILGNIYNQADLQEEFALYAKITSLAKVAFSGNYNDLLNIPPVVSPNLQQVTDKGNTTTNSIVAAGLQLTDLDSSATTMVTASPDGILGFQSLPSNTPPGGPNNSLQFNEDGSFNGSSDLLWDGFTLTVSGNVEISSLASTGTMMVIANSFGELSTQTIPTGEPSGPNTSIQYNNAGVFGGSDTFLYTNSGHVLIGSFTDNGYTLQVNDNTNGGAAMSFTNPNNGSNAFAGIVLQGDTTASYIYQTSSTYIDTLATQLVIQNTGNGIVFFVNASNTGQALTIAENGNVIVGNATRGALYPPSYSTSQKLNLSVTAGALVYDSTLNQISYYNGTTWVNI